MYLHVEEYESREGMFEKEKKKEEERGAVREENNRRKRTASVTVIIDPVRWHSITPMCWDQHDRLFVIIININDRLLSCHRMTTTLDCTVYG